MKPIMDYDTAAHRMYAMLWARDRNPSAMANLKLYARLNAEKCAFKEARKHKWALFLGDADKPVPTPYTWFNAALTWVAWTRAHQAAGATGKVIYMYLDGDFTRHYGKVYPNSTRN